MKYSMKISHIFLLEERIGFFLCISDLNKNNAQQLLQILQLLLCGFFDRLMLIYSGNDQTCCKHDDRYGDPYPCGHI